MRFFRRAAGIRADTLSYFLVVLLTLSAPLFSSASDFGLEKDLQGKLRRSLGLLERAGGKLDAGVSAQDEIGKLISLSDEIRASHLLLQEKFRVRAQEAKTSGLKAGERHRAMEEGYLRVLGDYLNLIESLQQLAISHQLQTTQTRDTLRNLQNLLESILPRTRRPIHGSLPYRNLNYPPKEPLSAPSIVPAYKGGNKAISPEDTADTEEAPHSFEIATLAQSLNWNPVSIYEYVKNNIETEWYWGCMKGAEETLMQKAGNDCDQATLLTALLRASGFPARYVRGTIEFFAGGRDKDIDKVKNLTGIEDPLKIAEFFRKAGIPYRPVIRGGGIANFQIEHIWVETEVPYGNYRGALIDDSDKTWLGLDTSIKIKGYTYNTPLDIFGQPSMSEQLSTMRDEYLGAAQTLTPLEYVKDRLSAMSPQQPIESYKRTKTLVPDILNILPASMQFVQANISHEYTEIPDELKHKIKLSALSGQPAVNGNQLFEITMDTMELSNKQIALSYEPETVEDQQIIDSYGGLDNTPSYLVRLRPILKVDGQMVVAGKDGLPMGADHELAVEIISPNGTEKITGAHVTGNPTAIGIVAQRAIGDQLSAIGEEDDAETILYKETNRYIDRWNKAEEEFASLFHLIMVRPIPTVVTVGGVIDVTYLLDMPHGYDWKGVYIDASLRSASPVPSQESGVGRERQKAFMQLSALEGSILENRIFEDDFGVDSISTAKMVQIAGANHQSPLQVIDKTNVESVLSAVELDENIEEDIRNSVNQNLVVRIPSANGLPLTAISYKDWTGIGYIKEDPATGEAGYMLSGMIAGGMTAISPDKWADQNLRNILGRPYGGQTKTIIITSPKNGTVVTTPFVEVTGIVLAKGGSVQVNGMPAVVEGDTFRSVVSLVPGVNGISASVMTAKGTAVADTVYVTCKIPVRVIITFPFEGAEISSSSIFVDGVVSDPGAAVDINGKRATVSPDGRFTAQGISLTEGTNIISATARGQNGTADTYAVTVTRKSGPVAEPMTLTITSPADGATVMGKRVAVSGTYQSTSPEVAITVNGVVADTHEGIFSANGVPLAEGANVIIATAWDGNGSVGRAQVTVNAQTTVPHVTLNANITSGLPPLKTYFVVSTEIPNAVVQYQMDFEGDGLVDYTGTTFDNVTYTYTTEGVHHPRVTITDDQGNVYSDAIAITVLNREKIDAVLKAKWEGMKGALLTGNIELSLGYFVAGSKDRYRRIFTSAGSEYIYTLISRVSDVRLNILYGPVAECWALRPEPAGVFAYPIEFLQGVNGIWEIVGF